MNPLTLVKRIQSINSKEASLGISDEASWHAKYKDSAYIFVGGIPYDLTEGDLLAVFAQYGEIVDVNLVRDKGTGKSKGFAFIAYEDQRSTTLAVDNLNGAQVLGRIIRVDHVSKYKKKEEEDEETEQRKREERGVCRAFQRGECTRGAGCKFSHDEQRAANTGSGPQDRSSRWGHDKFESNKESTRWGKKDSSSGAAAIQKAFEVHPKQSDRREPIRSRRQDDNEKLREDNHQREEKRSRRQFNEFEPRSRVDRDRRQEKISGCDDNDGFEPRYREDRDRMEEKRSRRHGDDDEFEPRSREDYGGRVDGRSGRHETRAYSREDREKRARDEQSTQNEDSSSHHRRDRDDRWYKTDRR